MINNIWEDTCRLFQGNKLKTNENIYWSAAGPASLKVQKDAKMLYFGTNEDDTKGRKKPKKVK